jgi:hypothetical protein
MNSLDEIQSLFKKYLPHFFNVFPQNDPKWRVIQTKYRERCNQRNTAIQKKGIFEAESTLFDCLWDASHEDKKTQALLKFIDEIIGELRDLLTSEHFDGLRRICLEMVINFDVNLDDARFPESRTHTKISELALLYKLLKDERLIEGKDIKFLGIEYKLRNGKTVDFAFTANQGVEFVEVMSINIDVSKIESEEDLSDFLEWRYERKFNEKLGKIPIPELGGRLLLAPVIWGKINNLEPYIDYFKSFQETYKSIIPAVFMMCDLFSRDYGYKYTFAKVDEFLEFLKRLRNKKP